MTNDLLLLGFYMALLLALLLVGAAIEAAIRFVLRPSRKRRVVSGKWVNVDLKDL